jgi:aspartate racemase
MRLLGLIGGMSWENTIEYYRFANELVKSRLGGWNSAKILLYSVNFREILSLQNEEQWDEIAEIILNISKKLETAGSSAILLCSNTMHKIADDIEKSLSIPLIHVIDETAKIIISKNIDTIGLLGTKFTMEDGFYRDRLEKKYNLKVILPDKIERKYINNTIYNEFAKGDFLSSTKQKYLKIIDNLLKRGAEGIILGCTEIPFLIKPKDVKIPLFDTLKIHLRAAINFVLS